MIDETPGGKDSATPAPATADADKLKKKKDKARTVWISFFGRIVAQIVGAVASVALALLFLQRYQSGGENETASPKTPVAAARVSTRNPNVISLAVLPLTNLSGDPQQEYFADGMTEALITDLAQLQGLRVISRSSSMRYKGGGKSIPQVAAELDVDLIVEGSVIETADSVRVTLDPLSGPIHQTLGLAHYYGRRFSAAAAAARRSLELTPHLPLARVILARSLIAQGAFTEAITVCGQASSPPTPEIAGTMALAQFRAGDRARAQASIDFLRAQKPAPVTALARWYALTGDADTALRLLEEAAGQGMRLQSIKNDPDFDRLRANARFTALLQRF